MANSAKYVTLTEQNFDAEVLDSDSPVLVDFWAPWCGPCRVMTPIVEDLAIEFENTIKVAKLNTDEEANEQLASDYHIEAIPAFLFFKDGQVIHRMSGVFSKEKLTDEIRQVFKLDTAAKEVV